MDNSQKGKSKYIIWLKYASPWHSPNDSASFCLVACIVITVTLYTTVRRLNQHKYPSTDEWKIKI